MTVGRYYAVLCEIEKPFYPNLARFEDPALRRSNDNVTSDCWLGYGYERDRFSDKAPAVYKTPAYRTLFGPIFAHSARVYEETPGNVDRALTRLTACRLENDRLSPDFENNMRERQAAFLRRRCAKRLAHALRHHYRNNLDDCSDDFDLKFFEYACAPHPKRKLRMKAAQDLILLNLFTHETFVTSVKGKFKKYEFAKNGKYPRLIVDMGVLASLLGGYAAMFAKHAMETFTYSSSCVSKFVGCPSPDMLTDVFRNLITPVVSYFCYFSDDSCFAARCSDGIFRCNLDISTCDGSHTAELFEFIRQSLPLGSQLSSYLRRSMAQLLLPMRVNSPHTSEFINLKPLEETLYSGSTLTTLVNNYANLLIHQSISRIDFTQLTVKQAGAAILRAANDTGYVVTLADCSEDHRLLQFLKHSPTAAGEPYLNLGVILRTLGQCKGDLPGRSVDGITARASAFNSSLMLGFRHSGDHAVKDILTEKLSLPTNGPLFANYLLETTYNCDRRHVTVSDDDICSRYSIDSAEWTEFLDMLGGISSRLHQRLSCRAIDKIFALDYGYDPVAW